MSQFIGKNWSALKRLMFMNAAGSEELTEQTATGNPATFTTNKAKPIKEMTIPFAPIQDLHGQSYPYPAGSGPNLFNDDSMTLGQWITGTGEVQQANGGAVSGKIPVSSGTNYVCARKGTTPYSYGVLEYSANDQFIKRTYDSPGDSSPHYFVLTTDANTAYVKVEVAYSGSSSAALITSEQVKKYKLVFGKGTTEPAYAPYSNICPISGRTEVNIYRSGEDTSNPETYTVEFPAGAGTVYGGTLTINQDGSGQLVVDRAIIDGGDVTWNKEVTNYRTFWCETNPIGKYGGSLKTVISSNYKPTSDNASSATADNYVWMQAASGGVKRICVKDTSKASMTATEFKEEMTGVQFCYDLATTVSYDLTATKIKTLIGTNKVWTDTTGDNTIKYFKKQDG